MNITPAFHVNRQILREIPSPCKDENLKMDDPIKDNPSQTSSNLTNSPPTAQSDLPFILAKVQPSGSEYP